MDRNTALCEAREEGLTQGIARVINNLNKMNLAIDIIAGAVKLPIEYVLKILNSN